MMIGIKLVSLRHSPGRPESVVTPTRLSLKNTHFEGGVPARWRRVDNATFYEYQFVAGLGNPDAIIWESVPITAYRTATLDLEAQPLGEFLSFRVRAIGAKGPSPFTETATDRIN